MLKLSAKTTACRTSSCLNSSRFDDFFFDMVADICHFASWEIVRANLFSGRESFVLCE